MSTYYSLVHHYIVYSFHYENRKKKKHPHGQRSGPGNNYLLQFEILFCFSNECLQQYIL